MTTTPTRKWQLQRQKGKSGGKQVERGDEKPY